MSYYYVLERAERKKKEERKKMFRPSKLPLTREKKKGGLSRFHNLCSAVARAIRVVIFKTSPPIPNLSA